MAENITCDISVFINAIKKRSPLYDKTHNKDLGLKRQLWEEVCSEVVPRWKEFEGDNDAVKLLIIEVQKKWTNMRTCFGRELRNKPIKVTKKGNLRRRKYIYFDELLFLLPYTVHSELDSTGGGDAEYLEENATLNSSTDDEYFYSEVKQKKESDDDGPPPSKLPCKVTVKSEPYENYEDSYSNNNKDDNPLADDSGVDGDRHFALSLVPSLRAMSEDEKYEAKIEILQTFKRIMAKRKYASSN